MRLAAVVVGLVAAVAMGGQAGASSARLDVSERKLVKELNKLRVGAERAPLRRDSRLGRAADRHTRSMINRDYRSHTGRPRRTSPGGRMKKAGVRAQRYREILAFITTGRSAEDEARFVAATIMKFKKLRGRLMTRELTRIGIGRKVGRIEGERRVVITIDMAG